MDCVSGHVAFAFSFLFYFIEKCISCGNVSVSGSHALCMRSTTSLTSKIFTEMCLLVGLVHYSRDLQTFFFNKIFIKNRSHGTIHTFKNYFATVFSIFSKISSIQTDPKCVKHKINQATIKNWESKQVIVFSHYLSFHISLYTISSLKKVFSYHFLNIHHSPRILVKSFELLKKKKK